LGWGKKLIRFANVFSIYLTDFGRFNKL